MSSALEPVRFLLVDDLEENLLSLDAVLRREGLELLKARSGTDALELLLKHEVALALLDVQMPDMDGFELAEIMRETERTRRVPIIFLTAGNADRQRRFRGYEAGAVDFLQKPIEPDILRSKADVFFDLHQQKQQLGRQRDELQAYAKALEDADRRKDEFLAILGHELRNPLAPIRNGLHLLRALPPQRSRTEVLDTMDRQMAHLVRLIDDLLDVARVSEGKVTLRTAPTSLQSVLLSAVEVARPLIDAGRHTLVVDDGGEPIWIEADLTRMAQVVGNLLNNAAKYTPEGGRITLSASREGGQAVITVEDNGVGISANMIGKIFDLFTQIDQTSEQAKGGLGIGLALVKRLVELHGGSISVQSAGVGKGSTFRVQIPAIVATQEEAAQPSPAAPDQEQRPLRILVVDDNVDVAQTVGWMLEAIGHEYELVHDGRKALEAAHAFRPDVVLLDIGLPGKDGYEVCREMRMDPAMAGVSIIAQSGLGLDRDRERSADAGFNQHLVKPVNLDKLESALAAVRR